MGCFSKDCTIFDYNEKFCNIYKMGQGVVEMSISIDTILAFAKHIETERIDNHLEELKNGPSEFQKLK